MSAGGKRRVKAVVDECEQWNEGLFVIVQSHVVEYTPAASRASPD